MKDEPGIGFKKNAQEWIKNPETFDEKREVLPGETLFHQVGALEKMVRLSSETVFLRIGPLFHWVGPRISPDRTFSN